MYIAKTYRRYFLALTAICALFLLPFLGLTQFNTKGEPREAIVAYTMIDSNNYILPTNNGEEFAYKPPMFHWMMAVCSHLTGGLNEYSSRLPSALAAILLSLATFRFYGRRKSPRIGFMASLVLLTTFETERAATNCRVDMLLTCFIVLALFSLFRLREKNNTFFSWQAMIWMGLATLTKGPVGILIPCMVSCVFFWSSQKGMKHFWKILFQHFIMALGALIIPSMWYYLAYLQGGDTFLNLIYEENVLRFIGHMPYRSHENGPLYYPIMLLGSLLPYTLLLVSAIFLIPKRWIKLSKDKIKTIWDKFRYTTPLERFTLLAVILILIFYTIPKSKRSVYILPIFPFLSYYIAILIEFLKNKHERWIIIYTNLLRTLLTLIIIATITINFIPTNLFNDKLATIIENITQHQPTLIQNNYGLFLCVALIGIFYLLQPLGRRISDLFYTIFAAFLLLNVCILPPILNTKSDKICVETLKKKTNDGETIYSYVKSPRNMLHFFTINFYSGNKIRNYKEKVKKGYLLIGHRDLKIFEKEHPKIKLTLVNDFKHKSCDTRQNILLFRIH